MATIYIDFSAANDGDGTTAAQAGSPAGVGAFNTIAGHISDGDIVWIRRVGTYNLASQFVLPNGGEINGWPLSTDTNYSSRPVSGQTYWDADPTGTTSDDYVTLTSTAYAKNILKDGAHDILTHMRRIHFLVSDSTDNNNSCPLYIQGNNLKVHNCYIERSGTNIGKGAVCFIKGASTSDWVSGTLLNNCILERSATGTTDYFSWWGVLLIENAHANIIQNCTLQAGNAYRGQNGGSILLTFYAYAERNTVRGCTLKATSTVDETDIDTSYWAWVRTSQASCNHNLISDCIIEDEETGTDYGKISISNKGVHNKYERIKLIRGGMIYLEGDGNSLDIFNSAFIAGASAPSETILLGAGADHSTVVVRASTFDAVSLAHVQMLAGNFYSNVYFSGCTMPSTVSADAGTECSVSVLGAGSLAGYWKKISSSSYIVADSSVTRTGGESFSLRGSPSAAGPNPITIGSPENPTLFLNLSSGANTIDLYGAYKNFATVTPGGDAFYFEIAYMNASDQMVIVTSNGNTLAADSSTWAGDTGLTKFKQTLSVTLPSTQTCSAWIICAPEDTALTAYYYLDPRLAVS